MKLRRDLITKIKLIKRNPVFWILCIFDFYILAFIDNKSYFMTNNYEQSIYRYNFQQVFIVFTCVFIVHIIFNEKELLSIKNYRIIYTSGIKQEMNASLLSNITIILASFWCGQFISLLVNLLLGGKIFVQLFFVNLLVVSMEIIASILLTMGFRMLFVKDMVVYGVYYALIVFFLIFNNVYISIPLTINILGIEEQGYYLSFDKALWIGRIILILIGMIIYKLGVKRFERNISEG